MSKTPRIKVTAEELYRRVLIDTIIRLFNAYKDMAVVRELLHEAFPGDKKEIDRFLAETSRTIEPLHEVSESAPKTSALKTAAATYSADSGPWTVSVHKGDEQGWITIKKGGKPWNDFPIDEYSVEGAALLSSGNPEAQRYLQQIAEWYPTMVERRKKEGEDFDQYDAYNETFPQPFEAAGLQGTASLRTQAGVKDIWNAFVSRIKSLLGGIASIDSAMDDAIAAVESVAGTEAQASMRHILTNKRADILEVVGSKDALKNSTLLPLFARLFKIQPIAMGPLAQSSGHTLFAREVQIPRIPESIRPQVMAVINQTAIKPEVEEAMKLLMGMKKANAELAERVKQVQEAFGSNESLKKAVPKATETVLAYVKKLTSKQRRLEDALFRATTRVKRGNVDYKTVVETLRAAAEQADTVLAAEIDKLLAANTRESENVDDLEIILDQVPQEARDQLREMSAPAPSAPATVPQS